MLSAKAQIFLILLLSEIEGVTKNDVRLFSTNKSFYTLTSYLQRCDLVKTKDIGNKRKLYALTGRGNTMALMLTNLEGVDNSALCKKYLIPKIW